MKMYLIVSAAAESDSEDCRIIQAICSSKEIAEQMCNDIKTQYTLVHQQLEPFIVDYNEKDTTIYTNNMAPEEAEVLYEKALEYACWLVDRCNPFIIEMECDKVPTMPVSIKELHPIK